MSLMKPQASQLQDLFHFPLSQDANQEFCELEIFMRGLQPQVDKDQWYYIYGEATHILLSKPTSIC